LKETKTKSGKREITLQLQAKETLLDQLNFTGKLNETIFHDSRTQKPWKNDQPIRKNVWTPALKRAGIIRRCNSTCARLVQTCIRSKLDNTRRSENRLQKCQYPERR